MSDIPERIIIIPSYEPDEKLINLIHSLIEKGLSKIIVVDDGSGSDFSFFFKVASTLDCIVLTHKTNFGKGKALKTAFKYIIENYPKNSLVACADSDGQHLTTDIIKCLDTLEEFPNALVMGCRQFDKKSIPLRSRFGNKVTQKVFKILCGVNVSDTQTGLRALTPETMWLFLSSKGDRFEYEMNMLLDTKHLNIDIKEVAISTVYIEENKTSHFNPLKDSFRIYSVFLKYIASSGISFVVDISIFAVVIALLGERLDPTFRIGIATATARIISSMINFTINKTTVFKGSSRGSTKREMFLKYYAVCIVQMLCSALFVNILFVLIGFNEVVIKLIVDSFLFIISFQIQREWVFSKNKVK